MKLATPLSLLVATCASATPTGYSPRDERHPFNFNTTKSLVAFGDSYTFVQGTFGHPNYSFIGDAFNLAFTPSQLLSNRIVLEQNFTTQGTAEGGPNWVEYLTGCGLEKGLTDPQSCKVQLWDFAYAGADTVSKVGFTPPHWNHTVSLEQQVQQFVDYGNPALESIGMNKNDTLVAIWIGINDINDLFAAFKGTNATLAPLFDQVQTYLFASVQKIYALGFKNFLFMNLPPLDRGPSASLTAPIVSSFNAIHATHTTAFQAQHPDATVLQFDVNSVLNHVLNNYQDYGFKNITGFCPGYDQPDIKSDPEKYGCGGGLDTYFWYNSGHLGSRTHEVFTKELRKWLVGKSERR